MAPSGRTLSPLSPFLLPLIFLAATRLFDDASKATTVVMMEIFMMVITGKVERGGIGKMIEVVRDGGDRIVSGNI